MAQGIAYISIGNDHDFSLAVSLLALRRVYAGPVAILTDNPQRPVLQALVNGSGSTTTKLISRPVAKGPAFALKSAIHRLSPFTSTIYLDADTLPCADPTPLFLTDTSPVLRISTYGDHTCDDKQTIGRLYQLVALSLVHPGYIDRLVQVKFPFINTGVFACTPSCQLGSAWEQAAAGFEVGGSERTGEEPALQMILPDYPYEIVNDSWNCMPQFSKRRQGVKIWHCPGGTFGTCPDNAFVQDLLRTAVQDNWCRVNDWGRRRLLVPPARLPDAGGAGIVL